MRCPSSERSSTDQLRWENLLPAGVLRGVGPMRAAREGDTHAEMPVVSMAIPSAYIGMEYTLLLYEEYVLRVSPDSMSHLTLG